MKILLTNHHFIKNSGTEIYTYTLAKYLLQNKHSVTIYSAYLGNFKNELEKLNCPLVANLDLIKDQKFDIAHVHHNLNAVEIRHFFPQLPIIFQSHGVLTFLEQPPVFNLEISQYLAICEGVKDNLQKHNISENKIQILRNFIDPNIFKETKPISQQPKSLLSISHYLPIEVEYNIIKVCNQLGISYKFIGGRHPHYTQEQMVTAINNSDIIISLGRGAMEAMFCGRIPIIYDYQGSDGMVTPSNFSRLITQNFSGRIYRTKCTAAELEQEIQKYKPEYGQKLKHLATQEFDADINYEKLINIYKDVLKQPKISLISSDTGNYLDFMVKSLIETRNYSSLLTYQKFSNLKHQKILRLLKIIK